MNDTKWNELRLAMHAIERSPQWSVLSENGYYSPRDRDWYYHFSAGGYKDVIHVDIFVDDDFQRELVLAEMKKIHLPGTQTTEGFRIFGYLAPGETVVYL